MSFEEEYKELTSMADLDDILKLIKQGDASPWEILTHVFDVLHKDARRKIILVDVLKQIDKKSSYIDPEMATFLSKLMNDEVSREERIQKIETALKIQEGVDDNELKNIVKKTAVTDFLKSKVGLGLMILSLLVFLLMNWNGIKIFLFE